MRKNIYFYAPAVAAGPITLNTTPLYLNSWLKRYHSHLWEKIQWKKIQYKKIENQERLLQEILFHDIDILCIGAYIWNKDHILDLINGIKSKISKDLIVVIGGPSSNPNSDPDLMQKNVDIDFAVYGQGEHAFAEILEKIFNQKKLNALTSNNLAWRDAVNKIKVGTFQWLKNKDISPYLESAELLEQIIKDPEYKYATFLFPYESSWGCQYNCSFCDWSSGLTHKVYHRSFDIEQEIDLLGRLGLVNIYLADANFGQHRQDLQIAETMARFKKEKNYQFKIWSNNWSKLNKKNNFKIIETMIESDLFRNDIKIPVQDTNQLVLANIDRPDVSWVYHRQLIEETQKKYPTAKFKMELIQGLPGQTRDTWEQTLIDVYPFDILVHPWVILPNSPAGYDHEYRKKFQIVTRPLWLQFEPAKVETVSSTSSFNFDDYLYFTLLSWMCGGRSNWQTFRDRRKLFDVIKTHVFLIETLKNMRDIFDNEKLTFEEHKTQLWLQFTSFSDRLEKSLCP